MNVILVDHKDIQIGIEEKISAHKQGLLHRAFSIFIFNSKKELMLQKRSKQKYHSAGLWTNTCCSHPRPNKDLAEEAKTRLKKEMGFVCELKNLFSFIYRVKVNGLIEHEYDHVFIGKYDGDPSPNKKEVSDWKWVSPDQLKDDIKKNPDSYSYWFKVCIHKVIKKVNKLY